MQGLRRQARTYALQLLYQLDVSGDASAELQAAFWERAHASHRVQTFGEALVRAVVDNQAHVDGVLEANLERWRLSRLSVIVRNALRLATAELLLVGNEPHAVIINEALELIRNELDVTMALTGTRDVDAIGPDKLWPADRPTTGRGEPMRASSGGPAGSPDAHATEARTGN
jgi:N utilization substance protein B